MSAGASMSVSAGVSASVNMSASASVSIKCSGLLVLVLGFVSVRVSVRVIVQ